MSYIAAGTIFNKLTSSSEWHGIPLEKIVKWSSVVPSAMLSLYALDSQKKEELDIMNSTIRVYLLLSSVKKIEVLLESTPNFHFKELFTHFGKFRQFDNSDKIKNLMSRLHGSEKTIDSSIEYYTTSTGRYLVFNDYMGSDLDSLFPILQAVGEIDAWLTITKFFKNGSQREKNKITMANYIENSQTPYLQIDNVWNPLLSHKTAVSNNIKMGGTHPQNLVITGPNAGGKSTNMDSIVIAAIMAQTFGIVPADHMVIAPFSLIHSHRDMMSDISVGLSSFKAESEMALKLIDRIKNMESRQFSLSIMDELFRSTNPTESEASSYGYMKVLSGNKNSMSILATHFPRLALLGIKYPNIFENKHVTVEKNNKQLKYDYLLKDGFSVQHSAIDILEHSGADSELTNQANDLINNPEEYTL